MTSSTLRVRFHYDDLPFVRGCGPMTVRRHQREAARCAGLTVVDDPRAPVDILHANTISPMAPRLFAQARERGAAVVAHAHTTAEDMARSFTLSDVWSLGARPHLRRVYGAADIVIAPSEYTRSLLEKYGIGRPIEVVSNGVDLGTFGPDAARRKNFREALGAPDDRLVAVSVGLVLERKGVRDFIEAAHRAEGALLAWSGEMPSPLISLAPRLRLAVQRAPENCRFLGFVENVQDVYCGADAFAFPSMEENQGIVTLEAAATGLPLVLRDIPVYRGWGFKHGENALLFRDAPGLAAHLRELAAQPELRARLGAAARKLAEDHALDRIGARLSQVYEQALRARKAA